MFYQKPEKCLGYASWIAVDGHDTRAEVRITFHVSLPTGERACLHAVLKDNLLQDLANTLLVVLEAPVTLDVN